MTRLPLEGIRVLTVEEIWAAPFITSLLGDMGAEVIKVETISRMPTGGRSPRRPPKGAPGYADNDPGEKPWERNATYHAANQSKLGITLDLKFPQGREIFLRLVSISDAVAENFAAGVLDRLGLGYQDLKKVKPDIIMLSSNLYGSTGPYAGYVGLGNSVDALAGHVSVRGYPGDSPEEATAITHSDSVAGYMGGFLILAALRYRNRTGQGQWIDMSQAEGFMPHLGWYIMDYSMNQRVRGSFGNRHFAMAPHGTYRGTGPDRWVSLTVENDEQWQALCQTVGRPELATDKRFADTLSRHKNQDELDQIITEWTSQRDQYEAMYALQKAGVPAGVVFDDYSCLHDPHLNARGFFEEISHREAGTHRYPGSAWQGSQTRLKMHLPPNCLGEHNEYVLGTILGMSPEEIAHLEKGKIIGTDYLPEAEQ